MSIVINKELCKNCGKCANVCPGSLIKRDEDGQIFMKYPRIAGGAHPVSRSVHLTPSHYISELTSAEWEAGCLWRTREICFCGISERWMAPQTR